MLMVIAILTVCLVGCGKKDSDSDSEFVKGKGKLVIGITDFKPMDYQESGSSEWIGFDADLAKAFAKELGVDCSTIAKYETGDRLPDLVMLCKLADFFGSSTDYLLGRSSF